MKRLILVAALIAEPSAHAGPLSDTASLETAMNELRVSNLRKSLIATRRLAISRSGNKPVVYGVVVNGDTEKRHQLNADEAADFMRRHYGVASGNLFFFSTDHGLAPTPDNLLAAAARLKAKIRWTDALIVYTTGHGNLAKDQAGLALADGTEISDRDFAKAFLDNKAASTVYFGDQCYSGGFAKAMTSSPAKRVIAVSGADECHNTVCTYFIKPYLAAFDDSANDNDPADGRVSEWEAFKVAKAKARNLNAQALNPSEWSNALYLTSGYLPTLALAK